ncbi:MAG: hypothetical protein IJA71_09505, partial [Clostridia bacterium]|nr:hypothetical protein [Clostridia bacterium]
MYTRKIYEPENELRIQIPGHGIGSAAGSSAQQEVRGKVSQPQKDRAVSSGTAEAGRRNTTKSGLPTLYAPKKNTWLSKGAFEDGYQFGDVVRGVNGTILETSENVTAGALDLVENTIDSVAGRAAGFGVLEEPLKKFVARDLIDEEKWARGYYRYGSHHGLTGMLFGVDPDRDSFLGEKAESLAQSVGQLTLAKAASLVGIPGEAVMAVNAYGAEMENAYRNGATPREANISASITAVGEVGTEMLSGAIKIGDTAVDDLLVENLSDGISNKLLKGLAGMAVGGTGEGAEEVLSEVISRFGQWITYMDDKTFTEMLLSGDAREAYTDSFIGGLLLGIPSGVARAVSTKNDGDPSEKTRGAPVQERTADPGVAQSQVTAPAEAKRPTTASRAEDALRRVHMGEAVDLVGSETKSRSAEMTTDTDAAVPDRTEAPKAVQPEGDVPYFTSDHWTGELEGLWTETDTRTAADTAIDMDRIYGPDIRTETDTKAVEQQPMRYEDALKAYLEGDTRFSAKPDV